MSAETAHAITCLSKSLPHISILFAGRVSMTLRYPRYRRHCFVIACNLLVRLRYCRMGMLYKRFTATTTVYPSYRLLLFLFWSCKRPCFFVPTSFQRLSGSGGLAVFVRSSSCDVLLYCLSALCFQADL